MSFIKCFDVVSMVVEEATEQFAPLWKLNEENYKILEQYCGVIDSLAQEFEGESYDVEVDEVKMTVKIVLECQEMTIESKTHQFYELAQKADSFGFSATEDSTLLVEFVFPSVWEKAA